LQSIFRAIRVIRGKKAFINTFDLDMETAACLQKDKNVAAEYVIITLQ